MLCDPEKKNSFVSRDVVFDEDSMLQAKSKDRGQGARWNFKQFIRFSEK